MPGRPPRQTLTRLLALLCVLLSAPAHGQISDVQIDIQREFLGLGGVMQRGVWTPVRLDVTNNRAENVEVTCRWLLEDADGDELITERPNITIGPQRTQGVWLYAVPPMSTRPDQQWVFQAVETESGELLNQAVVQLTPTGMAESSVNLVGLCGFKNLGLNPWLRWSTQHEQLRLVRGLNLESLPDRWYGLDSLSSLVWYPVEGGEPTSNRMSDASKRALREWVHRGGHLVIILPYGGQQWTSADSGLGDLIEPLKPGAINQAQARPPSETFGLLRSPDPVPMLWFDLSNAPGYTALADVDLTAHQRSTDAQGNTVGPAPNIKPMVVGHRVGFGQVTLVGLDLSETTVLKSIDAFRLHRVWTRIFNWRASQTGVLLPPSEFTNQQTANQYVEAKDAQHIELGTWIGQRVARQRQTGPAVGLAFVLFFIYAVMAGLTFPHVLRGKGWERHSWMLFVGIVTLFSAIAWGGAWLLRPGSSTSAHFTVLDIDGNSGLVRAQSWQSLLIPSFTTAEVAVPSQGESLARMDGVNLIASPGHTLTLESPGYPDRRTYRYDAAQPDTLDIPMRSTTKSLVLDYLGSITAPSDGMPQPWMLPKASLRMAANGLPAGTITHRFPGQLTDVHIIFCPGGGQRTEPPRSNRFPQRPLVYEYKNANGEKVWDPNTPLALPASGAAYVPLWRRPITVDRSRDWKQEGFLGQQVRARGFNPGIDNHPTLVEELALLSFYDALPPPTYKTTGGSNLGFSSAYNTYSRSLVRDTDLTPLITGRRIILIGHLKKSASPVPMTVDGEPVESEGHTVVRWIYDL